MKIGWRTLSLGALLLGPELAFGQLAPSSHFATLESVRIHYTSYGMGERALVFVHGWSSDETVWKKQALELAKATRVLTVDLPGHGQSDQPEIAYTMAYYARTLDAVLQDAGVKKATLVGHSNGTLVVWQFYRLYPAATAGLVIVDGSLRPYDTKEEMEKFIAPLRAPNYAETGGKFIDHVTEPMKDPAERAATRAMMRRTPQRIAVSEFESTLDPALWKTDKIEVPVLVILAQSPFWKADYKPFLESFIPRLQYETFKDVSHFLMLDQPREFNDVVLAFLKKNDLL